MPLTTPDDLSACIYLRGAKAELKHGDDCKRPSYYLEVRKEPFISHVESQLCCRSCCRSVRLPDGIIYKAAWEHVHETNTF